MMRLIAGVNVFAAIILLTSKSVKLEDDFVIVHQDHGDGRPEGGRVVPKSSKYVKIDCDDNFYMHDHGYLKFKLNKPSKCEIGFLGSRHSKCSTEIICTGIETKDPLAKKCNKEYIKISDGLGGEIVGCGKLTLKSPLKGSNSGRDLYIQFKGMSDNGFCEVFCGQDKKFYEGLKDMVSKEILKSQNDRKEIEDSCVCGVKNTQEGRIVGGETAVPFEYPWIAALTYSRGNKRSNISTRSTFCGASLINDRYLLSAAHCFVNTRMGPKDLHVVLHAHVFDLSYLNRNIPLALIQQIPGWDLPVTTDEDENSIRLHVKDIKIHPFYDPETFDFDIAVLTLEEKVNLKRTDLVGTVCLPPEGQFKDIGKEMVEAAGWGTHGEDSVGQARVLQKVQLPVISWADCLPLTHNDLLIRHMCAGFVETGGKDACQGDSGGPLVYKFSGNQHVLRGVVSAGVGCARKGNPGFYTDTEEVIEWIYYNTRKAKWCKEK